MHRAIGRTRAGQILGLILRDEVGRVAIGNCWYRWASARSRFDPVAHHAVLARRDAAPRPKPPFNVEALRAARFDEAEIAALGADPSADGQCRLAGGSAPGIGQIAC